MTHATLGASEWILWVAPIVTALWVGAFGACVGSLVNVLVYRLPLGLDVVAPTSRCPNCETKLTWRENIPIFGWLMLRGKCRFCRSPISPEYPIVETFTACLWMLVFLALYAEQGRFLGVPVGVLGPTWGDSGFVATWPSFVVVVGLFSCLIAVTLIDARTFHIPMSLMVFPVVLGLLAHGGHALWIEYGGRGTLPRTSPGWTWTIPTPSAESWRLIGAAFGGAIGVVVSNVLLATGVIKRSFADYDDWVKAAEAEGKAAAAEGAGATPDAGVPAPGPDGAPTGGEPVPADSPEMWTRYPHARREMIRELVFLGPIVALALAGSLLAYRLAGPWAFDPVEFVERPSVQAPLWVTVLAGVCLGYLVGGGAVWAMRLFGSLAFGKEAMGLGDVHLMAAVGACVGWIDSVLGLFGAAFVGLAWAILGRVFSGVFQRHMPFGPYLAIATVLIWFAKPWVSQAVALLSPARPALTIP
ncbi:MAG: prepilin peptidase [Planctomycetota bacterium]|nr:prepilin peptidase [Planctomycetota bacterium]